jgi:hypothetical protein
VHPVANILLLSQNVDHAFDLALQELLGLGLLLLQGAFEVRVARVVAA